MQPSESEPAAGHLARLATLLTEQVFSAPVLSELRTTVSAAISTYKASHSKHGCLEKMLEAASAVWVGPYHFKFGHICCLLNPLFLLHSFLEITKYAAE